MILTSTNGWNMRTLILLLVVAGSSSVARDALAGNKPAQEKAAKKACLAGNPTKGVEILAELYVDTNEITYIFNQGRCFEQNSRYEEAIGRFREYLVKGESMLSDNDKAVAQKRIEACESYLPKAEPRSPVVPPEPSLTAIVEQPSAARSTAEPEAVIVQSQPPEPSPQAGGGLRVAGIAVGALGVAAVISGVALNLKVNSMSKDLEKPDNFNRDTDSSRKNYRILAWVGYGVGAACVAGGSLLYYLGWNAGHAAGTNMTVAPYVGAHLAGATLQGAF